jgi:hypothetical protein
MAVQFLRRAGLGCWFLSALIAVANSQAYKTESVQDAVNKIKEGQFSGVDVNLLADAHAVQAIPLLKEQFPKAQDEILKLVIASALVRLGNKEEIYWNFLSDRAKPLVESTTAEVSSDQMYQHLLYLRGVAVTGDIRGLPLLRKALSSPNYIVEALGAKGLAKLQDRESIPLIIEACEKAPLYAKIAIAEPLVFFNDSRAQSAAERFIPDRSMLELFRKVSREKGPDGLF